MMSGKEKPVRVRNTFIDTLIPFGKNKMPHYSGIEGFIIHSCLFQRSLNSGPQYLISKKSRQKVTKILDIFSDFHRYSNIWTLTKISPELLAKIRAPS